jgi:hypothetical protein
MSLLGHFPITNFRRIAASDEGGARSSNVFYLGGALRLFGVICPMMKYP